MIGELLRYGIIPGIVCVLWGVAYDQATHTQATAPEAADAEPLGVWHREPNLTLPATVTRVIDGDTVEVQICLTADVRLLDCWAPETRTRDAAEKARGLAAKNHLSELVADKEVLLCVPFPQEGGDLGSVLTFGRVLGHLYLPDAEDGRTVSEMMVEAGHATEVRQ